MESVLNFIDYMWPVAVGALLIFHSWDIRQLRRRIDRLESHLKTEKKPEKKDDFWQRYESTRPK